MEEAGWSEEQVKSAGLVVGTSKGTIVDWIESGSCGAGVGDLEFEVARELRIGFGPRLTISAACASGLMALIRGVLMIKAGEAKRVLVVAAEASIHDLFVASFRRLGVLAKAEKGCRPFDEGRSGFLMSEAGAAVCLESASDGDGDDVLIENMAMGADATHLIGGDERARTLRALLEDVLDGRPADLVHAHGTGTVQNDAMELSAVEDCVAPLGGMRPALYSHKGALGHSLGAAGLVSVVINRMCHSKGLVPPGIGERSMPMSGVEMSQRAQKRGVQRSLAIAAGFGGAIGVVSLVTARRGGSQVDLRRN
jgi:3-oxoacyl-[acyl-carrier-protein] synthase II